MSKPSYSTMTVKEVTSRDPLFQEASLPCCLAHDIEEDLVVKKSVLVQIYTERSKKREVCQNDDSADCRLDQKFRYARLLSIEN